MMKMPKTYRVYTNVKKIGEDYYEATYKEYTGNELTGYGTEDFSKERLKTATKRYDVYCYNGKVMHGAYREGYRMTDCVGTIRVSQSASGIAVAKMMYNDVARVAKI